MTTQQQPLGFSSWPSGFWVGGGVISHFCRPQPHTSLSCEFPASGLANRGGTFQLLPQRRAALHFCLAAEKSLGWVDLEQLCVNSLVTGITQWLPLHHIAEDNAKYNICITIPNNHKSHSHCVSACKNDSCFSENLNKTQNQREKKKCHHYNNKSSPDRWSCHSMIPRAFLSSTSSCRVVQVLRKLSNGKWCHLTPILLGSVYHGHSTAIWTLAFCDSSILWVVSGEEQEEVLALLAFDSLPFSSC